MADLKHYTRKKTEPLFRGVIRSGLAHSISIPGYGQAGSFADPAGDLATYNSSDFQEKIYAYTDKSFYVHGEILWLIDMRAPCCSLMPPAIPFATYNFRF